MEGGEEYRTVSSPMKNNPTRKRVIGLRVSSDSTQGGRKYMEDVICIAFDREQEADYACFAVFDGHGGKEAALYGREHLWENIKRQDGFFSRDPELVMAAIKEGFRVTQEGMWEQRPTWPRTLSGYASTSGSTCSMAIICGMDMYTAHVGDSRIVMGKTEAPKPSSWYPQDKVKEQIVVENLTVDHKPGDKEEVERIESAGGRVQDKAGVLRVVWSRPKQDHQGPIRRNTPLTDIPFLAVARSLGDLWSYNYDTNEYIVSPEPDVVHRIIDPLTERFIVLGSDGLWNMVTSEASVQIVEKYDTKRVIQGVKKSETVSHQLIKRAMDLWNYHLLRADNISVITVFFEFPEVIDDEQDQIDLDSVKEWQNIGLTVANEEVVCGDENSDEYYVTRPPSLVRHHACTKLTSMENYNRLYCMSNKERRQYGSIPAPQYKRHYTDGLEVPTIAKKPKLSDDFPKAKAKAPSGISVDTPTPFPKEKIYKVIHTKKSNIRVEYAFDVDKQNANRGRTPEKVKARKTFLTKSGPIEVLYECEPPKPSNSGSRSAPPKSKVRDSGAKTPKRRRSLDDGAVNIGQTRLTRSATKRSKVMSMHMTRSKRASILGKLDETQKQLNGAKRAVKMR